MHTTSFHPVHPIHTACTAMLSTAITAFIFALVIVLPAEAGTPPAASALSTSLETKTAT